MRDRIFADQDKRYLFEKLCLDKKENIFNSNKDLILFAAALGYKHNQKFPLKKRDTEIPLAVFQRDKKDFYFIDIIALGDLEDISILDWDNGDIVDKKLGIFEEYANAGLVIIEHKLFRESGDVYDNLLQLIYKEINEKEEDEEFNLSDLIEKI
ncbi:DNA phosphorothioation-associated protein 4 [Nitratiruptor sp. SB155-2]|uniref:DNA phosphorothioation-associated protein 4 n=1 Tax=Nitratiruptor sp. (strain SB155-2) TaxID=387092 RepID=UPI0001587409|nr:DNA phosphorothioation-associated protein 4 [Nitratiruptor sp. SB155-2]BAF70783.1 conserved hypothetical protein [Nitratiruptor sp. SB155-2]